MTRIDPFGGAQAWANGINDAGQIVGWANTLGGATHAFLYTSGTALDLHEYLPPDANMSVALAINDTGAIAGAYGDVNGSHAFLYKDGSAITLPEPGGSVIGSATGINALSEIVGYLNGQAFLYSGGVMTALGSLGGPESRAFGINRTGQIVGYSFINTFRTHPFLYSNGIMRDLNDLLPPDSGWELYEARGINDAGQIVGVGVNQGAAHAFLLSPANPAQLIGDLISMVGSFELPKGIENSFVVKLEKALGSLEAGDTAGACDRLKAFINHVQAQAGKAMTTQQAADLVAAAEQVRSMLGCP